MRKRAGRPQRFAVIPNETIDDAAHLDLTALGLLAVLLRHRDGWEITLADIGARYGYGEVAMARAMGLLQVARYVVKIRIRDKAGHWSTEVVVYDTPATDQEIADLVAAVRTEPGVCDVRIIEPTKSAIAHAEKRRNRLSTESGFSGTRCDLRKHPESPGHTESRVYRDSVNPGVIKKTVKKKTKNPTSPYPLAGVQEPHGHRPQEEEEGIPQTDHHGAPGGPQRAHAVEITVDDQHTPSDLPMCQSDTPTPAGGSRTGAATGDHGEAAALVADLPAIATRAGRPLTRALRADETTRLTALVAAALARGWTADQIRAVLADDLQTARSPVATWHARLAGLGNPPADEPAPAAPPKCDECNPYRWIEDDEGRPVGRCPTCHPALAGRRSA